MSKPSFPPGTPAAEIRARLYDMVAPLAEKVVATARFAVGDGKTTTLDYSKSDSDQQVTQEPLATDAAQQPAPHSKQNGGQVPAGLGGLEDGVGVRTAPTVFITSTTASSEVSAFPLLTVGPVIGLTTDTTTRILIEANTTMTVQMRLRLVERNVRLTRGNQRQHDQGKANSMLSTTTGIVHSPKPQATVDQHRPHPQSSASPATNGHSAPAPAPASASSAAAFSRTAVTTTSLAQVAAQEPPARSPSSIQPPEPTQRGSSGTTTGSDAPTGPTSTEQRPAPATRPSPTERHEQTERDLSTAERAADGGDSYAPSVLAKQAEEGGTSSPFHKGGAKPDGSVKNGVQSGESLSESVEDGHVIEKDVDCTAHRVSVVTFTDLTPDCRYEITFPNLRTRVTSTVTTLLADWKVSSHTPLNIALVSCNLLSVTKDLALPDSDLWLDLRRRVAEHEVDYVCHIGDQIYADEKRDIEEDKLDDTYQLVFKTGVNMLKPLPVTDWPAAAIHIKELYRQLYRETWSHPPTAFVLANAPSLMIYDDHDFRDDWGNEPEDSDPSTVEYYVGRCAHEVMCEYQRQLWDNVDFTRLAEIRKDFHFHVLGEHGIVFLDVRGPRSLHRIEDEPYPYLGSLQWKELKAAMSDDGIMRDVKSLLMICPAPIVFLPTSINDFLGNTVIDDALGHWSSKPFKAEQLMMLSLAQAWKAGRPEREITFIGGDVHVGGHSEITRDGVVLFQQFVTSAISNYRLSKFEFFMGQLSQDLITTLEDGWGFKHRGFTRQRNYGLLQVGRDDVGPFVQRQLVTPKGEKPAADNRRGTAHLK